MLRVPLLISTVTLLLGLVACGDDFEEGTGGSGAVCSSGGGARPCVEDPWSCPATQTCWIDDAVTSFTCLNQGSAPVGGACEAVAGSPSCLAGLFCFQPMGAAQGTCVAFCDNTNPSCACSMGTACRQVGFENVPGFVNVCVPGG